MRPMLRPLLHRSLLMTVLTMTVAACTFGSTAADAANRGSTRGSDDTTMDESNCPVYGPPRQLRMVKSLPDYDVCQGRGTSIVAFGDSQVLFLCKNGHEVDNFDFSMGRGGTGKTREGDLKTPLGTYPLGRPRSSDRFGTFIPVGYPTAAQKAKGYSGSDVGIHGPDRRFRCAGFLNVSINWTQGCMAVADDTFIERIASFVKQNPGLNLHIIDETPATPATSR